MKTATLPLPLVLLGATVSAGCNLSFDCKTDADCRGKTICSRTRKVCVDPSVEPGPDATAPRADASADASRRDAGHQDAWPCMADECFISGRCYRKGVPRQAGRPSSPWDRECDVCDPAKSRGAWTELPCVRTIAGDGTAGLRDGSGATARVDTPVGLAVHGSVLYASENGKNHSIRRIDLGSPHRVRLLAGGKEGAPFNKPTGLAVPSSGVYLYVADRDNRKIRRITIKTTKPQVNVVGTSATFSQPALLAVFGGTLYVAEDRTNRVRAVGLGSAFTVKDIAVGASISGPYGLATSASGGKLYISGNGSNSIWSTNLPARTSPRLTLVSRDDGTRKVFNEPAGLAVAGSRLYVADSKNHRIRVVDLSKDPPVVTTLAGPATPAGSGARAVTFRDGPGPRALFNKPLGIAISPGRRELYVADSGNHRIRAIRLPRP